MSIHLRSRLALAACLVLVGSVAEAAPKKGKKAKKRHEVVQPVETQDDADDDVPAYFVVKAHAEDEDAAAAADDADDTDDADDAKVARAKRKARHKRVRSHRREAVVEDESDEVVTYSAEEPGWQHAVIETGWRGAANGAEIGAGQTKLLTSVMTIQDRCPSRPSCALILAGISMAPAETAGGACVTATTVTMVTPSRTCRSKQ